MLVLTLSPGKAIRIGDNVIVQVVESHRGHIRVGIEAPRDVRVIREEAKVRKPA